MIIRTQDLKGEAFIYFLWLVEGGQTHKRSQSMWYFPHRKLTILKSNWKPWENRGQAFDILDDHQLCVWHDMDGWHAGAYASCVEDRPDVFVDAETPALAICLAAIAKHFGEHVAVPVQFLEAA